MACRRGKAAPFTCAGPALTGAALAISLAACATAPSPSRMAGEASVARPRAYNRPYEVLGRWYVPADQPGYDRVGVASWYSYESHSRTTADGEAFDARLATAAHTTLPIPSWLEVTNLDNGRSARVRLNDRGPFVQGRLIDLSRGAAEELGFTGRGTARVRVRYLGPAGPAAGAPIMWARAAPAPRIAAAGATPVVADRLPALPPPPLVSPESEVAQDVAQMQADIAPDTP